jgi:hypothetical protein
MSGEIDFFARGIGVWIETDDRLDGVDGGCWGLLGELRGNGTGDRLSSDAFSTTTVVFLSNMVPVFRHRAICML